MSINLSSLPKQIIKNPFFIFKPKILKKKVLSYISRFKGKTIYAVKTNSSSFILNELLKNGVDSFDVASLNEIKYVKKTCSKANLYFMNPIKSRESISEAYFKYGVRHFSLDSEVELKKILEQTDYAKDLNLHLRVSVPNKYAKLKIEKKFGVEPSKAHYLIDKISLYAKKTGICFHPGSQCLDPNAYSLGLKISKNIICKCSRKLNYLNVGGGFPVRYSKDDNYNIVDYFDVIHTEFSKIPNYKEIKLLSEPGRCLVADSLSLVVRVELRKNQNLYINDGIHGSLYSVGLTGFKFDVKMINPKRRKTNKYLPFSFYGPTCDSNDYMRGPFILPDTIEEGDYIEIFKMGAYSQTMQTSFNGFGISNKINVVNNENF